VTQCHDIAPFLTDNALMADLTIWAPIISASAAVAGATIPAVAAAFTSARQRLYERRDKQEAERREACLALLQAVGDLRTQVMNNFEYHGPEMATRLALVRAHAASVRLHAIHVALAAPPLSVPADELAVAAEHLARATAAATDLNLCAMLNEPDLSGLDNCMRVLGTAVVNVVSPQRRSSRPTAARPRDGVAATPDQ
jgi:hypothetical protein